MDNYLHIDNGVLANNRDPKHYYLNPMVHRIDVRLDLHPEIRAIIFDSESSDEIRSRLKMFSITESYNMKRRSIEYYITCSGDNGLSDRYFSSPELAVIAYLNECEGSESEGDNEMAFYQMLFEQPGLQLRFICIDDDARQTQREYYRCMLSESEN